jgi:glycosyltransferase involved in cell wall biosynthesis
MTLLFSVCLYTHNRADLLAQALESISNQALPPDQFEIIVVDNHSTDGTRRVVEDYSRRFTNLSYHYEEQLGSASARNRGWREAKGEYIGFIDDDGKAPPEWLSVAARVVRQQGPDLFGGPIYPFYDMPKPGWFKDTYGTFTVLGESRYLTSADEYLSGSNLFARRSLLEEVGGFEPSFGMYGRRIGYGEETVLIRRVRQRFPAGKIYYAADLSNYHLVRQEKMSFNWQLRHRFAQGRDSYHIFNDGSHHISVRHILGFLALPFILCLEATLGVLLRDRRAYPYAQNYYYERLGGRIATLGKLYERLRSVLGAGRSLDA